MPPPSLNQPRGLAMKVRYVAATLAVAVAIPASAQAITMARYATRANAICTKYEKRDRAWLAKMRGVTPLATLGRAWLAVAHIDAQAHTALTLLPRPAGEGSVITIWLAAKWQLVKDESAIAAADSRAWNSARQSAITNAYTTDTFYYRGLRDLLGAC
jgi:hypothetical protein